MADWVVFQNTQYESDMERALIRSREEANARSREQDELELAKLMSALTTNEAAAASALEDDELARAMELSAALSREDADMARAIARSAAESAERTKKAADEQQKRANDAAATAAKLREDAMAARARSNALNTAGYGLGADGRIVRLRPSHAAASPTQSVPTQAAASPAKAPVPEFRVVGGESPTSGVNNNCLLQSLINIGVIFGMTAWQIREMLIAIVLSGAANDLIGFESVEDMLWMLRKGKQLGDVFVRILAYQFRKTIVVFKLSSDGKWTSWIHGKEYDNWNGCALLHRGDIGEFEEGHYTTFRLGAGTTQLTIRGDSLPAVRSFCPP